MAVENLITEHIDIWTSAVKTKSTSGRGSSNKLDLYGIKKLRELILELAVRGKLVPQDPNDEPASVLLERIAEEKKRLVKDKLIPRTKGLPPINEDEIPIDLPNGWTVVRLGELTSKLGSGSTPRGGKNAYTSEGIPFLRSQNVRNEGIKLDDIAYISEEIHQKMENTKVLPGDVLLNITGASLGRSTIFPSNLVEANVSQHVTIIRLIESQMNQFIHLGILSPLVQQLVWGRQVGMAIEGLSKKVLEMFEFPIPPIAEQHRIVAKVDELMALCDQLEQQTEASVEAHQVLVATLLDTLTNSADADELMQNWARISEHFDTLFTTEESIDQLKQTILQLAVMGKLVPQDPSDEPAAELLKRIAEEKAQLVKDKKIKKPKAHITFEGLDDLKTQIPSGWHWIRLSDTAELVRGGSPRPAGDPRFYDGEIPFLKVGDVTRKSSKFVEGYNATIKEAGLNKTRLIETRTVLLSNSGATLGVPAICEFPATFNDGIAAFIEKSKYVYDEYLYLYLSTKTKWFLDIASRGQGQPNLNTDIIKATWFPLAPFEEQYRIVCKVDELLSICEHLNKQILESQATQLHLTDSIVDKAV